MNRPMIRPVNPWVMPLGQLVLGVEAPREQWLEERRKGLGSSDAPLLMGFPQGDDTEYGLWLDKTGRVDHQARNEQMRRGIWLEPHVVEYFSEQTGLTVRRCGLVANREHSILRATPDRLTEDGGVVEIKTIGAWAKTATEWRAGIARHAFIQAQWQLMVTGRSHAWFCAYAVDQEPMVRGPIDRDEPLIERMISRGRFWWDTYVVADLAPPVDLSTITDEEITLRWPTETPGTAIETEYPAYIREMLRERAELKATEKAAAERTDEIDRALRAAAKEAEALLVDGRPVVTFKTQNNPASVSPALETDHPDIWKTYVKRGTHRHIRVRKGWDTA